MGWVQATKTAKQPGGGITAWQVLRWTVLAVLLLVVVQMLRQPSPPTASAPTQQQALASAASFRTKLDGLAAAHEEGSSGQEAHFSEDELNAYIQQSTGALPNPQDAAPTPPPVTGSEDAAGSVVKSTSVGMTGDEMTVQIVIERFGREIYFTLAGKLSSDNGYATFHPTRCKLGELSMPLGFIDEQVQQKLNEPQNRERMKLPDFIRDVRVENGELVIVEK